MSFLDRFVYRNARTKHISADAVPVRGTSLMQPALGAINATDTLYSRDRNAIQAQPLNREAFWSRRAEEVAPEEAFFHQYFGQISAHKRSSRDLPSKPVKVHSTASDNGWDDDVGADEDEIWRALVGSRKELGDDDLDMDDASEFDEEDVDIADEMVSDSDNDAADLGALSADEDDEDIEFNLESDDSGEASEGRDSFDEDDVLEVPSEGLKSMDDFAEFDSDVDDGENDDVSVNLDSDEDGALPKKQGQKTTTDQETSRQKKRRLKALPTFASAEDYAQLIDEHDAPDGGYDWKTS